jgi:hypothetical protein
VKIYLDVCCLNRPFDDQGQERIRIESEAVITILGRCRSKTLILLSSEVVDLEISKIPDDDRKQKVMLLSLISKMELKTEPRSYTNWALNLSMPSILLALRKVRQMPC